MYLIYKKYSHTGLYHPIGSCDELDKAKEFAKELSKWATPDCNEMGQAKITNECGEDLHHYEDGSEVTKL